MKTVYYIDLDSEYPTYSFVIVTMKVVSLLPQDPISRKMVGHFSANL